MWGLSLELPVLGLGFFGKVSVSKFALGLGGYGLDYITGRNIANAKDEPDPNLNPNCSTDDNFVDMIQLCSMNKILKMKISDGFKVFS